MKTTTYISAIPRYALGALTEKVSVDQCTLRSDAGDLSKHVAGVECRALI